MSCLSVNTKKYIAVVSAILETLLFCGIAFGWSSIVFVLKREGIYSQLCFGGNQTIGNTTDENYPTCARQDEMLQLAYTIAISVIPFINFFIGGLFNKFGIRFSRLMGSSLVLLGLVCLTFLSREKPILLFPGLSAVGIGGMQLYIANIQVGNMFGRRQATLTTMCSGALDASSVVFLVAKVAYDHGISRNYSFFTLSILCIAPFITTFTLYPKRTIPLELGEDEGAPLVSSTTVSNATAQAKYQATTSPNTDTRYYKPTASKTGEILHDNTVSYSDGYSKTISDNNSSFKGGKQQPYFSKASTGGSDRWSEIHFDPSTSLLRSYASSISTHKEDEEENTKETNLSLRHYLSSSTFLLHNAWYVIMSLRWGYFVGNVNPWLHTLTTETAEVSYYTDVLGYSLLAGSLFAPLVGMLVDRALRRCPVDDSMDEQTRHAVRACAFALPLGLVTCMGVLSCVLVLPQTLAITYPAFLLITTFRAFLFGINVAYIAVAFPSWHYGWIYGIVSLVSGPTSFLLIYLFLWGNANPPASQIHVNLLMLCLTIVTVIHPINLWRVGRKYGQKSSTHHTK